MVVTRRTLTDLKDNLFQDGQEDGAITAQDVRDMILSIGQVPFGSMYTLAAIETVIPGMGTYTKGLCTTQSNSLRQWDMPVDNRLRYTGAIPYHMHIACSLSMKAAANQKLASFKLYHFDDSAASGAVIDGSQVNRFIAVGVDEGSTALPWDIVMDENDYLELWVANLTDGTDITVSNFYLFALGMAIEE